MQEEQLEFESKQRKPREEKSRVAIVNTALDPHTMPLEAFTRELDRMIKGRFVFPEAPGQTLSFVARLYKGQIGPEKYVMRDGQTYEIPLSIARMLNERVFYTQYKERVATDGFLTNCTPSHNVARAQFVPLSY